MTKKRKSAYIFRKGDEVRCIGCPEAGSLQGKLRPDVKYHVISCDQNTLTVSVNPLDGLDGAGITAGSFRFIPWKDEPVDIPEHVIEQGDTVRCINNQGAEQYLMEGRDYHVESVSSCGRQRLRLADIQGCGYEWQQARFELVKKAAGVKEVPDVVSGAIPLEGISRETLEKLKTPHPLRIKSTRNDETGETETTVEEIPGAKIDKEFERLLFTRTVDAVDACKTGDYRDEVIAIGDTVYPVIILNENGNVSFPNVNKSGRLRPVFGEGVEVSGMRRHPVEGLQLQVIVDEWESDWIHRDQFSKDRRRHVRIPERGKDEHRHEHLLVAVVKSYWDLMERFHGR
jgi:hypothetical protein